MMSATGEQTRRPSPLAGIEVPTRRAEESLPAPPSPAIPETEPVMRETVAVSSEISALLAQARAAQKQLASQPLPIANHNLPLIQKLFGG